MNKFLILYVVLLNALMCCSIQKQHKVDANLIQVKGFKQKQNLELLIANENWISFNNREELLSLKMDKTYLVNQLKLDSDFIDTHDSFYKGFQLIRDSFYLLTYYAIPINENEFHGYYLSLYNNDSELIVNKKIAGSEGGDDILLQFEGKIQGNILELHKIDEVDYEHFSGQVSTIKFEITSKGFELKSRMDSSEKLFINTSRNFCLQVER